MVNLHKSQINPQLLEPNLITTFRIDTRSLNMQKIFTRTQPQMSEFNYVQYSEILNIHWTKKENECPKLYLKLD